MTTYTGLPMIGNPGRLTLPSMREMRAAAMNRPSVMITGLLCATVIVLAFVGSIVFLALNDRSTEALTITVVTPLVGALVAILSRQKDTQRQVAELTAKVDQGTK